MATLKDVALRAGVSTTTVSHALNGTRFVEPDTAARVYEAVRELGYSPNSVARGLRTGTSRTIGVIGPTAQDPFFAEVVLGIEDTCYRRGYDVYLGFVEYPHEKKSDAHENSESEQAFLADVLSGRFDAPLRIDWDKTGPMLKESSLIEKLLGRDVDGLIVNPIQPDIAVARALAGVKPDVVLFHRVIPGVNADAFVSDDCGGMAEALSSLLDQGHTRIGMVYGHSWESHAARGRYRAYRDTLLGRGIEPDLSLLALGDYSLEGAAGATARLLALETPPTAILYWSDPMAIAGIDEARTEGLSVPADLSVVGFDDLPISARVRPRLSSIRQEKFQTGEAMAERLIDRIEGKIENRFERIVLKTEYVARESVSPNVRSKR